MARYLEALTPRLIGLIGSTSQTAVIERTYRASTAAVRSNTDANDYATDDCAVFCFMRRNGRTIYAVRAEEGDEPLAAELSKHHAAQREKGSLMRRRPWIAITLGICSLLAGVTSVRADGDTLHISHAWLRTVLPSLPAAGYFDLSNSGSRPEVLVSASSPACGQLMFHESHGTGGTEQMRMVESVTVPARGNLSFSPGSYHLMCTSPTGVLMPGHRVPVTLNFEDGASVTAQFEVRGPAAP